MPVWWEWTGTSLDFNFHSLILKRVKYLSYTHESSVSFCVLVIFVYFPLGFIFCMLIYGTFFSVLDISILRLDDLLQDMSRQCDNISPGSWVPTSVKIIAWYHEETLTSWMIVSSLHFSTHYSKSTHIPADHFIYETFIKLHYIKQRTLTLPVS